MKVTCPTSVVASHYGIAPLKQLGRKKWGAQDSLRAHKALSLFSVYVTSPHLCILFFVCNSTHPSTLHARVSLEYSHLRITRAARFAAVVNFCWLNKGIKDKLFRLRLRQDRVLAKSPKRLVALCKTKIS